MYIYILDLTAALRAASSVSKQFFFIAYAKMQAYILPHLGWIAAKAPNRVNRAHGSTKEMSFELARQFW